MRARGRFADVQFVTYLVHPPSLDKRDQHLGLALRQRLERCELTMVSSTLAPAFVQQFEATLNRHEKLTNGREPHVLDEAVEILDLLDQPDGSLLQALARARPMGRAGDHDNPHPRRHERRDQLRAIARLAKVEIKQHDARVSMQAVS